VAKELYALDYYDIILIGKLVTFLLIIDDEGEGGMDHERC
jgi:hypothetical protein